MRQGNNQICMIIWQITPIDCCNSRSSNVTGITSFRMVKDSTKSEISPGFVTKKYGAKVYPIHSFKRLHFVTQIIGFDDKGRNMEVTQEKSKHRRSELTDVEIKHRAIKLLPKIVPKMRDMAGSPGLVVMGGDSCSKGHEFESQHRVLDGRICCRVCSVFEKPKIN